MKRRSKGDKAAARELILFAENESSIYPQRVSIHKNLLKKIKAGKYSDTKAAKLWGYWFEAAAKSYARQMANASDWNRIFSAATRRLAARSYASSEGRILKAAARGETDEYVYSNPRKKRRKNSRVPKFKTIGEARAYFEREFAKIQDMSKMARKNPVGHIVVARGRGQKLFFDGKKFTTRGRPKVYGTHERARKKANELADKYRALDNYGVFATRYDPKS